MKMVWCPETASKAYIDTVKSCELFQESSVAELVSAMAGGWSPRLIVETWSSGSDVLTSVGLATASRHNCARHVCVVPDERARIEYTEAMNDTGASLPEIIVGGAEEVINGLLDVDFMVVDCRRKDFAKLLRNAKLSHRGAVLVCKNANPRNHSSFRWRSVLNINARVVRSAYLPVGKGVEIAHVAISGGGNLNSAAKAIGRSRWIRHIDQKSGEEHVYRR